MENIYLLKLYLDSIRKQNLSAYEVSRRIWNKHSKLCGYKTQESLRQTLKYLLKNKNSRPTENTAIKLNKVLGAALSV